jgi:hypothetical protein
MSDLRNILREEYIKKEKTVTSKTLTEMIEEVMLWPIDGLLNEEERFSYTIAFPKLVPTEAWGDPNNMDRREINRIFSVIRGGNSISARIGDLNKFLTPESAKRKRSPNVILNMMMITEALQATLNDYNESSAGFVFEAFMAALTGGHQVAGRVRGTLPIEDFVAFSGSKLDDSSKAGAPVSLKLLSPTTTIKGSFTNLVDYLFVRGEEKIAYLIAYKNIIGGKVENLIIFDFEISRSNLIDMMIGSKNQGLLAGVDLKALRREIANWDGTPAGLGPLAELIVQLPGYTAAGMLHGAVAGQILALPDEEDVEPPSPEELEQQRQAAAEKAPLRKIRGMTQQYSESFHQREKRMMLEEDLLMEGNKEDTKSQWGISRKQMDTLASTINLQAYGELDLSQKNISELVEIYSEILGDSLRKLLDTTKELSENIGRYYSESKRNRAMAANNKGQEKGEEIVDILVADPKYAKETT